MAPFLTQPKETFPWGTQLFPGHYGSPDAEWQALLDGKCFLEHPHLEWLQLQGKDAVTFLQGLITADLRSLQVGHFRPSYALDAQGKILAYLRIFRSGPQDLLVACPEDTAASLQEHLERYVIMEEVRITRPTAFHLVLTFGLDQEGLTVFEQLALDVKIFNGTWANRHPQAFLFSQASWPELETFLQAQHFLPLGWISWHRQHILALDPWFPLEIVPGTNPVIYQIPEAISARKGCYIGQETVAMTRDRGRAPFQLARLASTDSPTPSVARTFFHDGKSVGTSQTSAWDDKTGTHLCLATLKHQVIVDAPSELKDQEGRCWKIQAVKDRVED